MTVARKTMQERRADALAEVEAAKKRLAQLETDAANRLGRLALKAGLVDLDLTDEQLTTEFNAIAAKFRQGSAVGGRSGKAKDGEG